MSKKEMDGLVSPQSSGDVQGTKPSCPVRILEVDTLQKHLQGSPSTAPAPADERTCHLRAGTALKIPTVSSGIT